MPTADLTQLALVAVFAAVALLAGGIASLAHHAPVDTAAGACSRRLRCRHRADSRAAALASDDSPRESGTASLGFFRRSKKDMNRPDACCAGIAPARSVLTRLPNSCCRSHSAGRLRAYSLAPPTLWLAIWLPWQPEYFAPRACGSTIDCRKTSPADRKRAAGCPDLPVVCIEAGSGIDQAILKTSDEIPFPTRRSARSCAS